MSVAKRDEFDKRLESSDLPENTAEAVVEVILGVVDAMPDFARDAAKEVFEILRPWRATRRLDLVKGLNHLGAGERVLGAEGN